MIPLTDKELLSFPFASPTSTPFILFIERCNITIISISIIIIIIIITLFLL